MRPTWPGWDSPPPPQRYGGRRRPELGGVAVLVVVTVLAALAAPHARTLRELVAGELAELPVIGRPGRAPAAGDGARAGRAVAFALAQRGKPYRWGAQGPAAFDCSGLTWAAWQAAGVAIPRTAAGQLAGLPRVWGGLRPGDLLIYRTDGPSGRHVAMVVARGRMACLFVLAVTAYGVAEDLGVLDPPARAAPAPKPTAGQPTPSSAAVADIPPTYLRLYRQAGARYRLPWPVLAAIGKVESDHGRVRLPGVRSGSNWAGACGPMQIGCVPGSKAGNAWARYGHGRPHDPAQAIPAAARYLIDHGARRNLDRAIFAYNHSRSYVAKVKQLAHRYGRGGGRP